MAEQRKEWTPRTELGRKVASGQVATMDEILSGGKKILEPEIVDVLLPDLKEEVLEIKSVQRMTASGRKQRMRAVVILGNRNGYISCGIGTASEARDAIGKAIVDAKKHIVKVQLGSGSWEDVGGKANSIPQKVVGKNSSTEIILKPAPRGVGIVAGRIPRKVLALAGVQDVYTFSRGRTRNVLNSVLATIDALDSMNKLKQGAQGA